MGGVYLTARLHIMDNVSKKTRSRIMSKIRSKDTFPEIIVRLRITVKTATYNGSKTARDSGRLPPPSGVAIAILTERRRRSVIRASWAPSWVPMRSAPGNSPLSRRDYRHTP